MRLSRNVSVEQINLGTSAGYIIHWNEANVYFAKSLAERIKQNVIDALASSGYSSSAVRRWIDSITVEYAPGYIAVKWRDKILNYIEFGTRASKPRKESKRAVPIRLSNGAVIFRRITFKSLMRGGWRRPDMPGRFIIREAMLEAVEEFGVIAEQNLPLLIAKINELLRRRQS